MSYALLGDLDARERLKHPLIGEAMSEGEKGLKVVCVSDEFRAHSIMLAVLLNPDPSGSRKPG